MNEKIKKALENLKTIRFYVGACSEEVCDYFKQVEETLNDFDRCHESQQDLINGKDEYIAKLCNDRAEKSSALRIQENNNIHLVESNLRLMEENKELRTFVKVLCKMKIVDSNHKIYGINENDIELVKKVVEKYGKINN